MNDTVVFWLAALAALIGTILLYVSAPSDSQELFLSGTVSRVDGRVAYVMAEVPVVVSGVRAGEQINRSVFWSENRFVARRSSE